MKNLLKILLIILLLVTLGFSAGTKAGTNIYSPSINIELSYSEALGEIVVKNGSSDTIADITTTVMTINGLVEIATDISSLESTLVALGNNCFSGASPNTEYVLNFTYLNRGNIDDEISLSANIEQDANPVFGNWSGGVRITANIAEDSTYQFFVTLNTGELINTEKVTIDILTSIIAPINVVSYNAFLDAYITYGGPYGFSGYGGTNNIQHAYTISAEGYDIAFLARTSEVLAPATYSGESSAVVPGSKIRYTISLKNNSNVTAKNIVLSDYIPVNCHLYYTDEPVLFIAGIQKTEGVDWQWPAGKKNNNVAAGEIISFTLDIPPQTTVSASFSVTID